MKSTGKALRIVIIIGLAALAWDLWPRKAVGPANKPIRVETPAQTQKQNPQDEIYLRQLAELKKFFARHGCADPDGDIAGNYMEYANQYGLDYRLLPAISVQESSCGKHQLYNNWWGFGSSSSLVQFKNIYQGMDYVMSKLTDHPYAGKDTAGVLQTYGPHPDGKPSPTYYKEVMALMDQMQP